jgi:hypothetical protein
MAGDYQNNRRLVPKREVFSFGASTTSTKETGAVLIEVADPRCGHWMRTGQQLHRKLGAAL